MPTAPVHGPRPEAGLRAGVPEVWGVFSAVGRMPTAPVHGPRPEAGPRAGVPEVWGVFGAVGRMPTAPVHGPRPEAGPRCVMASATVAAVGGRAAGKTLGLSKSPRSATLG